MLLNFAAHYNENADITTNGVAMTSMPVGKTVFLDNIFNAQQWARLASLVDDIQSQPALLENIAYGKGALKDKKFSLSLYKFIARQAGVSYINHSPYTKILQDIIQDSPLIPQISAIAQKPITLLRMQLNVMTEGGYVGCHKDDESDNAYLCSVLIRIGKNYTGGAFVIYDEKGEATCIDQDDRTILVMSAKSPHEVKTVWSGVRHTICLFCGE